MKKLIAILATTLLVSPTLYGSEETKTKKVDEQEKTTVAKDKVIKSRCECTDDCSCDATKCTKECNADCKSCNCEKKK